MMNKWKGGKGMKRWDGRESNEEWWLKIVKNLSANAKIAAIYRQKCEK